MLHEMFHILYDEQSLAVEKDPDARFKQNPSKYSIYAFLLLNEVPATALGSGYVFENLSGKPDTTGEWYNWSNLIKTYIAYVYLIVIGKAGKPDRQESH